MRKPFALAVGLWAILGSPTAGAGATRSLAVTGTDVITSPEGHVRILLEMAAPHGLENAAVGACILRAPLPPLDLQRDLHVWIAPIRTPWIRGGVDWEIGWENPGGDVHEHLAGRWTLERGDDRSELQVDLTNAVNAVKHGAEFFGLLVAVPRVDGDGLEPELAEALRGVLGQAVLEIEYRGLPDMSRRSVQ